MGDVVALLNADAHREVAVGGLDWRVHRVRTADVAEIGFGAIVAVPGAEAATAEAAPADGAPRDPLAEARKIGPARARKIAEYYEALVCAGVIAARDPESGEWQHVRFVLDEARADAGQRKLWIGTLRPVVVRELAEAVLAVTTEDGEAVRRLAAFRRAAGDAAGP